MVALDAAVIDRIRGCLWGVFIADALAMPVHWFYNPNDIVQQFGKIAKYEAPQENHPSSIMSVSNTGGHGRGGQGGSIIGDVINHGKKQFWGVKGMHYHQGMAAGENTLNALCARVVMRGIADAGGQYSRERWLQDYVSFMTTPGSHNDTYAESYHRDFFANYAKGVPPERCAEGTEGHNTASIGGFVMLPPVVAAAFPNGRDAAADTAVMHLATTHESAKLAAYARTFAGLLCDLLSGEPVAAAVARSGLPSQPGEDDLKVVYKRFGPACYIDSSFPVAAHFLTKYQDDFEAGVLANTNAGGENCHRGAAVGALLGAHAGEAAIPAWMRDGLHESKAIKAEIDAFVSALQTAV
eukprot:jgi/Ulvmu1/9189/UM005_0289.1